MWAADYCVGRQINVLGNLIFRGRKTMENFVVEYSFFK